MARSPVTRVQLDAYRFGQRRLESALARRDPVPLHEEVRAQQRVVAAGVVVSMLALVAVFVVAKVSPAPAWNTRQVVVGAQSGRMFAVVHGPDRLVPVANLAAARLVLAAARQRSAGGFGGPGRDDMASSGSGSSDLSSAPSSALAVPEQLDDAALDGAPRTATAAVAGAPGALLRTADAGSGGAPGGDVSVGGAAGGPGGGGGWALCESGPDSTLVAGAIGGTPLAPTDGLLLRTADAREFLVVGGHKHRIDAPEVLSAYDLLDHRPRPVSAALLERIPDGVPLDIPELPTGGGADSALAGRPVGDVVRVVRPGQPGRYYLALAGGLAEVPEPVANLVRAARRVDQRQPPDSIRLEEANGRSRVTVPGLAGYPPVVPTIVEGPAAAALCWRWAPGGYGGELTASPRLPLAPGRSTTSLAQADHGGARLDAVALPPRAAVVACSVTGSGSGCSSSAAAAGALWLMSDTGVGYPIADAETALALGIREWQPVPADALRELPTGPTLDLAQARRTVDVLVDPTDG